MLRALPALAALLLASAAYAQQPPHPMPGMGAGSPMADAMGRMEQAMRDAPMTGDADHDFVVMMIPHHQGAIDMAQYELEHGKDKTLRALARRIIADQKKEIGQMQAWLKRHGGAGS